MSKDNRTEKVLEKWGGNENMNQEDIRKAAESYANIKVKNRMLKWIAVVAVVFMIAFLGLMLGSVILGIDITKEFKVKNGALVVKSDSGKVIETSEMLYDLKISLMTPVEVIKGLKSIKIESEENGQKKTLQFNVVTFYYIMGKKLTLYGHTHMANVLANGTMEVFPITYTNGARSIDESKRTYGSGLGSGIINGIISALGLIYDCNSLRSIGANGIYSLIRDLTCTLNEPLLPEGFNGILNGFGNTLTLNMNIQGEAALFARLNGATIINLYVEGNIIGKGNCSAISVRATPGTRFISSAVYANVDCSDVSTSNEYTTVGGFAAILVNPNNDSTNKVLFYYAVLQARLRAVVSNVNQRSYVGGMYGKTERMQAVKTLFNFTTSAGIFSDYGNSSFVNRFGFKYAFPSSRSNKRDVWFPEDCFDYNTYSDDLINTCVEWYRLEAYENPDCCAWWGFNSCPYIHCSYYTQTCDFCRHKKKEDGPLGFEDVKIVPAVKTLCSV